MTIIRFLNRTRQIIKLKSIQYETFPRNLSILSLNTVNFNDRNGLKQYQEPKIYNFLGNQFVRNKFKKSKQNIEDEDEIEFEQDNDEDKSLDKHSKLMKVHVNSLRLDLIIKSGLGIARNKVEVLFYESKIRVNGQKVDKKSGRIDVGDEIDVVKGVSQMNPDHLIVQRVEIINVKPKDGDDGGLVVSLRRHKSLIIENYEDPYKGGNEDQ
uniref:CSON012809 protein n=1 Tax=Culicoides sonorensis TaxID=179676 RepID=A0A336KKN8_CULSO